MKAVFLVISLLGILFIVSGSPLPRRRRILHTNEVPPFVPLERSRASLASSQRWPSPWGQRIRGEKSRLYPHRATYLHLGRPDAAPQLSGAERRLVAVIESDLERRVEKEVIQLAEEIAEAVAQKIEQDMELHNKVKGG